MNTIYLFCYLFKQKERFFYIDIEDSLFEQEVRTEFGENPAALLNPAIGKFVHAVPGKREMILCFCHHLLCFVRTLRQQLLKPQFLLGQF